MIRIFSFAERPHIECFKHYRKSLNRVANFSILRNKYAASTASHMSLPTRTMQSISISFTILQLARQSLDAPCRILTERGIQVNNPNHTPQPTQATDQKPGQQQGGGQQGPGQQQSGQSKPGQQQQNVPGKTGQQGDEKKS
jgi:hypothetical protein